jgi:hypothetical protein
MKPKFLLPFLLLFTWGCTKGMTPAVWQEAEKRAASHGGIASVVYSESVWVTCNDGTELHFKPTGGTK